MGQASGHPELGSGCPLPRTLKNASCVHIGVYPSTDFGRLKNGTWIVESGRLRIEIERESRGGRWRTGAEREWRRTNLREVESVVTTTLRDEARRWASGVGTRRTSPPVLAAPLSLQPRLLEPEVMHTSIDEANASAAPATGQGQFGGHRSLRENLLSRASRRA